MSKLKTRTNQPVQSDDGIEDAVAFNKAKNEVEVGTNLYVDGKIETADLSLEVMSIPDYIMEKIDGDEHEIDMTEIPAVKELCKHLFADYQGYTLTRTYYANDNNDGQLLIEGVYGCLTDHIGLQITISVQGNDVDGYTILGTYNEV